MVLRKGFVKVVLLAGGLASLLTSTLVYAESGTFVVGGSPVNVRRSPSTSGEIVAQYSPGEVIEYDSIVSGDGYSWASYVGGSGSRNYVAIGTADGSESFGSLSGGSSGGSSRTVDYDFSAVAGSYTNNVGDSFVISADGTIEASGGYTELSAPSSQGDGTLSFSATHKQSRADQYGTGSIMVLIPAGVSGGQPNSDSSRTRVYFTQGPGERPSEEFYYRDGEGGAPQPQEQSAPEASQPQPQEQSSPEASQPQPPKGDFSALAGKWVNKLGEEVSITKEGIVTQYGYNTVTYKDHDGKVVHFDKRLVGPGEPKNGLYLGAYESGRRFNNYYIFAPAGVRLIDQFRSNEDLGVDDKNDRLILVRAETGPSSTPIEEFLFTRVKEDTPPPSSTTSKPSETKPSPSESSKKESKEKAIPWEAFKKGDFSHLVGTWKNGRNEFYLISADGRIDMKKGDKLSDQYRKLEHRDSGAYIAPLYDKDGKQVKAKEEFQVAILEAGQAMDWLKPDNSDHSKLRLLPYQTVKDVPAIDFFYRVDDKAPKVDGVTPPKASSTTKTETASSSSAQPKSDASQANQVKQPQANAIQKFYQGLTNRQSLPSTGEAATGLGLLGLGLWGLIALLLKRRRQKALDDAQN